MTGKDLVVYENYAQDNAAQIARLKSDQKLQKENWKGWLIAVAIGAVPLSIVVLWVDPLWLAIVLAAGWFGGYWWMVFQTNFVKHLLNFRALTFTCPHCEQETDVAREWKCGWCTASNDGSKVLVFDQCGHEVCRKSQSAVRCHSCGHDIIIDNQSYLAERAKGFQRIAGVAVFDGGAPQAQVSVQNLGTPQSPRSPIDRDIS